MLNSWSCLAALIYCWTIWLSGSSEALQHDAGHMGVGNSIAAPGQPLYYLMADVGPSVGPNDELKRTNRSLMKWWDDLFGQNNCCNNNNNNNLLNNNNYLLPNNCNGLQLQNLDPFKQMKLFKKLPDLWGNNCGGQCGQCGGGGLQPVNSYVAPAGPGYGGNGYAPPQPTPALPVVPPVAYNPAPAAPSGGYETPNPAYDGPGDGDAGYVAPPAPPAPPAVDSYEAPPATDYAAPPAAEYEAPAPAPPTYEPAAPAPAPESYTKVDEYAKPVKSYGGAQPPQIVYQPIIYLSASPGAKADMEIRPKPQEQSYGGQTEPPKQLPVYEPPSPVYTPPPQQLLPHSAIHPPVLDICHLWVCPSIATLRLLHHQQHQSTPHHLLHHQLQSTPHQLQLQPMLHQPARRPYDYPCTISPIVWPPNSSRNIIIAWQWPTIIDYSLSIVNSLSTPSCK